MDVEPWWPSRFGPDDQAGALNEITPAGVVAAAGLVSAEATPQLEAIALGPRELLPPV
jgi:hypothetical protein